jgi:hypothetical protein
MPEGKSAPLCRGQRYQWLRYHQVPPGARHDAHIVAQYPLPSQVSLADLRSALSYLVRRHEALRTVYEFEDVPEPRQRVQPAAPLPLRAVSVERDGTPSPQEVLAELTKADFDLAREWPIRACAVTADGVPTRLVLVLNHIAFDDWSVNVFKQEFELTLEALVQRRRAALPPVRYQPTDLAGIESVRAADAQRTAREHWVREVGRMPADAFAYRRVPGITGGPAHPVAHSGSLTSPTLLSSARQLAGRLQVWPSAVHLAAYAVAMAAYTGVEQVVHRWFTSLRADGPHMSVMTCMFSPALVRIDVPPAHRFSDLVREVARRVELAQERTKEHAAYDELGDMIGQEGSRRGQLVRLSSDVNFLNYAPRTCGASRERYARNPVPTAWAESGTDTYFRVYEWQDGVTAALSALSEVMDADSVERFLRGYARLVEAHRDPAVDLSVGEAARLFEFEHPPARRTVRVGPDAVDPDETAAVLRMHPDVSEARVSDEDGRLVADVVTQSPVTPAELRSHMQDLGHTRPGARCPDWFRVAPLEGDGRDGPARAAATPAERALAESVARAHAAPGGPGIDGIDLARSYTDAGGRALCLPRVVSVLRELGWSGIGMTELTSIRPLFSLAADLVAAGAEHERADAA